MKENGGRRPRFRRGPLTAPLRLTERDQAIFHAVQDYRFLTTTHIWSLVGGSRQNVTRRLQRLYHAGLLDRPRVQLPLRFSGRLREIVHSPTGSGKKEISSLFLAHALSVSEVLVAVEVGSRQCGLDFDSRDARWRATVRSNSVPQTVGVIPDAVFSIERPDTCRRFHFLLESDRGSMPVYRKHLRSSSIYRKALAYYQTRRTKALERPFGISGFQVLFVTHSVERLDHMRKMCATVLNGRFPSLFLFTTFEDLAEGNPFTMAWRTCGGELIHMPGFKEIGPS